MECVRKLLQAPPDIYWVVSDHQPPEIARGFSQESRFVLLETCTDREFTIDHAKEVCRQGHSVVLYGPRRQFPSTSGFRLVDDSILRAMQALVTNLIAQSVTQIVHWISDDHSPKGFVKWVERRVFRIEVAHSRDIRLIGKRKNTYFIDLSNVAQVCPTLFDAVDRMRRGLVVFKNKKSRMCLVPPLVICYGPQRLFPNRPNWELSN